MGLPPPKSLTRGTPAMHRDRGKRRTASTTYPSIHPSRCLRSLAFSELKSCAGVALLTTFEMNSLPSDGVTKSAGVALHDRLYSASQRVHNDDEILAFADHREGQRRASA